MNYKMRITVSDKYCIDVNDYNHDLKELIPEHTCKSTKKTVAEAWKNIGHYPNTTQCLNAIIKIESCSEDCSISEWLDKVKELGDKYHSVF